MPEANKYAFLDEALNTRKKENQYRQLTLINPGSENALVERQGKSFINFSSNDYLGLAQHPDVTEKAAQYLRKYGTGSTASRLITGTYDIHTKLEDKIATALNREAALIFNSGFQANSSLLGTVTDRHSLILADKLSHSSLLQGALSSRADFQRFNHNDTKHLESLLQKAEEKYSRIWIVTETVFSMDGDRSPVEEIATLAKKYGALFFVDDAHAVGVWGSEGLGLGRDVKGIDILLGTCGKAFGSFGAYVACSQQMKAYLVNFCPGFIFTTAPPPAVIGATAAALDLISKLGAEREAYHQRIEEVRQQIQALGFDTGPSTTHIIPINLNSEKKTLKLAGRLQENGIMATAIRPPTVPANSSRIRLTITACHTNEHIERLLTVLKNWIDE